MPSSPAPTLVLGIGNILMADDGVGPRVVEELEKLKESALPASVDLIEGGTSGLALVDWLEGRTKLIVIDAILEGGEPGSIHRMVPDDLDEGSSAAVSLHDFGLPDALRMARQLGFAPAQVIIFGIVAKEILPRMELSPEVARAVPEAVKLVLEELAR
jgi:hydrogenase maturation protease